MVSDKSRDIPRRASCSVNDRKTGAGNNSSFATPISSSTDHESLKICHIVALMASRRHFTQLILTSAAPQAAAFTCERAIFATGWPSEP